MLTGYIEVLAIPLPSAVIIKLLVSVKKNQFPLSSISRQSCLRVIGYTAIDLKFPIGAIGRGVIGGNNGFICGKGRKTE